MERHKAGNSLNAWGMLEYATTFYPVGSPILASGPFTRLGGAVAWMKFKA